MLGSMNSFNIIGNIAFALLIILSIITLFKFL
jgi:hypothetical protein